MPPVPPNADEGGASATDKLSICVNTQTPLVQFVSQLPKRRIRGRGVLRLSELKEGVDYRYSPGGVTRMVLPLLRHLRQDGRVEGVHWVSLNPTGPKTIDVDGIILHSVTLDIPRLRSYGTIKETISGRAHGVETKGATADNMFWSDDYAEFAHYNRLTAELMKDLDKRHDFDLFYIHDFQQLPVGHMIGTLKPKVYRWHIPFETSMIPTQWTEPLSTYFNSYDLIVVSADKYLSSLKQFGYQGRVERIYPYVDPRDYSRPSGREVAALTEGMGVTRDDRVILLVARMDPLKGQDKAIRALARILKRHPKAKLVAVGNGSFSGSRQGLGLSKSERWRQELTRLCGSLGVTDRVLFTGHIPQRELDALYERCDLTLLPSVREGFGLVVVEGWLHRRPAIVTNRAGIAELIKGGKNGYLVDPEDIEGMAEKMSLILDDTELGARLGRAGLETSRLCTIAEGVRSESKMITELVGGEGKW